MEGFPPARGKSKKATPSLDRAGVILVSSAKIRGMAGRYTPPTSIDGANWKGGNGGARKADREKKDPYLSDNKAECGRVGRKFGRKGLCEEWRKTAGRAT